MVEAFDLDPDETVLPDDGLPLSDVTWPDGRVDTLPHTCTYVNLGSAELLEGHGLMHFGCFHVNPSMGGGGYMSADLARLSTDVFYSSVDNDDLVAHYIRGAAGQVEQYWLDAIVSSHMSPLPCAELVLCTHYGLLAGVPSYDSGSYGAVLFCAQQDADVLHNMMIDFCHSLAGPELAEVAQMLETAGCTWPGCVARGEPEAAASWAERVRIWEAWLGVE